MSHIAKREPRPAVAAVGSAVRAESARRRRSYPLRIPFDVMVLVVGARDASSNPSPSVRHEGQELQGVEQDIALRYLGRNDAV